MNAAISHPNAPSPTKPLWAAIGVLGMCVLAMGASLVSIHKRSAEPTAAPSANFLRFTGSNGTIGLTAPSSGGSKMITETADGSPIDKPLQAQENNARPASRSIAKLQAAKVPTKTAATTTATVPTRGNAPAHDNPTVATGAPPSATQAVTICVSCGTIEAVTPVTRPGKASGVGIVTGGVLGAVLGNQVGNGNGRTAATVLGAVGGGWAGNAAEKNIKKDTVYQVRVRMQDGSTRTLEQASAPAVGSKVTVDGGTLRTPDGAVYAPAPEQRARSTPQPQSQRDGYINGG
jgi:outer membrane lipoprotein SlyB